MKTTYGELLNKTNVVGVVASSADLDAAQLSCNQKDVDIVEIRLDKLPHPRVHYIPLHNILLSGKPLIVTVRDESEGGGQPLWKVGERSKLYHQFMPFASFVDVEAAMAGKMVDVLQEARNAGIGIIISYHNFDGVPGIGELINQADACRRFEGDVFKMALKVETQEQLDELEEIARAIRSYSSAGPKFKLTAMAIGESFGVTSRLRDVGFGGPFVYGYLADRMPGQPKAVEVKKMLAEFD